MTTPINTDKHVFFDDAGNVLSGGKIYIGQPGTDPRTNKKTVTFEDSAGGQFTAQQPLTTINGKISYNGKPIKALVDGEYSMLILDSADKQVDYSSSIVPPSGGGGSSESFDQLIRVGLTLSEVRSFDVGVGDVIRAVGQDTTTDDKSGEWVAVSNTGNPADGFEVIDFDNGLQGLRIAYRAIQASQFKDKESPGNGDFDSTNLGYWEETVELGGDFDSGETIKIVRIGNKVTISSDGILSHTTTSRATSEVIIPSWAEPLGGNAYNVYSMVSSYVSSSLITSRFEVEHRDWGGSPVSVSTTANPVSVSYTV